VYCEDIEDTLNCPFQWSSLNTALELCFDRQIMTLNRNQSSLRKLTVKIRMQDSHLQQVPYIEAYSTTGASREDKVIFQSREKIIFKMVFGTLYTFPVSELPIVVSGYIYR
jgi:hypothetical protein